MSWWRLLKDEAMCCVLAKSLRHISMMRTVIAIAFVGERPRVLLAKQQDDVRENYELLQRH